MCAPDLGGLPSKADDVPDHAPEAEPPQVLALCKNGGQTVAAPLQGASVHGERERHFRLLAVDAQRLQKLHKVWIGAEVEHLRAPQGSFTGWRHRIFKLRIYSRCTFQCTYGKGCETRLWEVKQQNAQWHAKCDKQASAETKALT